MINVLILLFLCRCVCAFVFGRGGGLISNSLEIKVKLSRLVQGEFEFNEY